MKDQAEKLRELMANKIGYKDNNYTVTRSKAKVLAVTSGKGGVGKTNFAINLAISIRRLGYEVLILDADIGLANVEILAGINIKYSITDLITSNKTIHEVIGEGPEGIKIISGGSGFYKISAINSNNMRRILEEFKELETMMDYVIIDTGAGVSDMVLDFVTIADEIILITTPDPTSIMDSYTMVKALTLKEYKGKLNIVANIVNNRTEAENLFNKFNKVAKNFLKVDLHFLGYLEKSKIVNKAVVNQEPFLISNPRSDMAKRINIMALRFIDSPNLKGRDRKLSFTQRLKKFILRRGD
ncbi:MAG TPA: MinD/ParA family protein [Tepidimicrobium sp.]|nr:MinD/ParA family protein [Tepidimicrobium sp.]